MAHPIFIVLIKILYLRKVQWCVTIFEILSAPIFTALMLFLVVPFGGENCGHLPPGLTGRVPESRGLMTNTNNWPCSQNGFLTYTPTFRDTEQVMMEAVRILCQSSNAIELIPVKDETKLMEHASRNLTAKRFLGSIVFTNGFSNSLVQYKIRLAPDHVPSSRVLYSDPQSDSTAAQPSYQKFSQLQLAVETALMSKIIFTQSHGFHSSPLITVEPFYYLSTRSVNTSSALKKGDTVDIPRTDKAMNLCIFAFTCGMIFMVPSITQNVVGEKQSGIKELLRLSGVPLYAQYIGWAFHVTVPLLLSTFLVWILFLTPLPTLITLTVDLDYKVNWIVFADSNLFLGWMILYLYGLTSACQIFLICSFLKNPTIATAFSTLLWLVTCIVGYIGTQFFPTWLLLTLAVFPNCAIYTIFSQVGSLECGEWLQLKKGPGLNFDNAWKTPGHLKIMTGLLILIMFISCLVFVLLSIYFDLVLPTEHGISRPPWLFNLRLKRKRPVPNAVSPAPEETLKDEPAQLADKINGEKSFDPENPEILANDLVLKTLRQSSFEPEPPGALVAVDIQKLVKRFGNKTSVNGVSLRMFAGDVFALLGHNGAGKTTTISMLTGFAVPTSGTAIINGYNIRHDMKKARMTMGFCPQHNMLFERLTVLQQLVLFGMIRGQNCRKSTHEAYELLARMNLSDKRKVVARKLSGGQKRKLQLAMALIGGTRLIILDEPTSGMDPQARREIWDILLQIRGERTILLTTHFMEEADVLGDRLAIMADGEVQCCGTAAFLKRHYGTGYTLKFTFESMSKGPKSTELVRTNKESTDGRPEAKNLLSVIHKQIPDASIKKLSRLEVRPNTACFLLPGQSATTKALTGMFSDLTAVKNKSGYEYKTISLQLTTMDEVFLRVGQLAEEAKRGGKMEEDDDIDFEKSPKISGCTSVNQFLALFFKKIQYSVDKWSILIFQFLLPLLLILGFLVAMNEASKPEPGGNVGSASNRHTLASRSNGLYGNETIVLSISDYPNAKTLYSTVSSSILSDEDIQNSIGPSAAKCQSLGIYEELEQLQSEDPLGFNKKYIVAFQIDLSNATRLQINAYFNKYPTQSEPLAINMATNIALAKTGRKLQVINHPLIENEVVEGIEKARSLLAYNTFRKENGQRKRPKRQDKIDYYLPSACFMLVSVAAIFNTIIVVIGPIDERLSQLKQIQLMTGVSPIIYWGSFFVWDFLMYLLFLFATLFMLLIGDYALGHEMLTPMGGIEAISTILLLYGPGVILYNYLITLRSKSIAGGLVLTILLHSFLGILLGAFFNLLLSRMPMSELAKQGGSSGIILIVISIVIETLGHLSPTYILTKGLCNVAKTAVTNDETYPNASADGQFMFMLGLHGLIVTTLFLLIEFRALAALRCKSGRASAPEHIYDEDVFLEAERVNKAVTRTSGAGTDCMTIQHLSKSFGTFAAVNNLSFGVQHGECFGLLGVNGAGKTTTFRMITGDETATDGQIYGFGTTIAKNRLRFLSHIGFCPQFDAILPRFTGLQMLYLFAGLRGVPLKEKRNVAMLWLKRMGLEESARVRCGKYSGGMKRRLSTAMAMIGDPELILLDEPTSGVDPVARRNFWKILDSCRASGQSIILTSHSLDECEALCARLGIMVNGQFQCFGSVDHLKNKFAQGYSLTIKLKPDLAFNTPEIDERIRLLEKAVLVGFEPCVLKDKHQNFLQFHLQGIEMGWSTIFTKMEAIQVEFDHLIEDYSVNDSSLEEVFLSFAKAQYGERRVKVGLCKQICTCSC